jgi:flavodoxin
MKLIKIMLLIAFAMTLALPFGMGKAEYAKKEGKACTFCHPAGKMKELTPAGQYYKDHNHSLEGYKAPASN